MLTVITGPPCAGKTTYARQHAVPGDIVIDFDLIAAALGSPASHGHDACYRRVAAEARHAAITEALATCRQHRVWIIDTDPGEAPVRQYRASGARFVRLGADPAELHRRADEAGRPPAWHQRIDEYLARHQADATVGRRTAW